MSTKKKPLLKHTQFRKVDIVRANVRCSVGYAYGYSVDDIDCLIMAPTKAKVCKVAYWLGNTITDKDMVKPAAIFGAKKLLLQMPGKERT